MMTISWHGALSTTRGGIGFAPPSTQRASISSNGAVDADAVDFAVGGEPADQHRDVVLAALAVGDVGEQERLAVLLGDAAAELPAHQRVHLGVLVDRTVDRDQQAGFVERAHVVVQVRVARARRCGSGGFAFRLGDGVHSTAPSAARTAHRRVRCFILPLRDGAQARLPTRQPSAALGTGGLWIPGSRWRAPRNDDPEISAACHSRSISNSSQE